MSRAEVERRAAELALGYVSKLKGVATARRMKSRVKALAAQQYDAAQHLSTLAALERAQKVLNRVSAAVRAGQLDATALDRAKLRDLVSQDLADYQANLLMRNALSSAYNAGYLEQGLADPRVAYWLYETRRDGRVRPEHARWEGLILRKDDPLALRIFPPNGHNCRCRMKGITRAEARALLRSGQATTRIPELVEKRARDPRTGETIEHLEGVDPGWDGPPAASSSALAELVLSRIERYLATE